MNTTKHSTVPYCYGCPVCTATYGLPNARVRVFLHDALIPLTLRPGQTLNWSRGGRTDEGWSAEYHEWTYDAETRMVRWERTEDGVDCDGRMTVHTSLECPIDRLSSYRNYYGELVPDWERAGSSQRDYTAEAAGY